MILEKKQVACFDRQPAGGCHEATAPVTPAYLKQGRSVSYRDLTFPDPDATVFTWGFPW